MELIETG